MVFSSTRTTLLAVLAAALVVVAYANSLHGPFTFDDAHEVLENRSIEDLRQPLVILRGNLTRPLVNFSYALDYARSGKDVFGFHVTNVVLHVVNVLLLFVVVGRLVDDIARNEMAGRTVGADATAFIAASLFAVHPMMTEAVSYVSGRSDLLATAFFLAGFYCFHRSFEAGRGWLAGGVTAFVLGLGSKETAAMLPFVLLAFDLIAGSRSGWKKRVWRIHAPLITVVVVASAIRVWRYVTLEQAGVGAPFTWGHVAMQAHVVVRYVSLLVAPVSQTIVPNLIPIRSFRDPRLLIAVISLAGLAALTVWALRRARLATFGLTWFALSLVPSSALSLPERINQPMAEHRVYLASCGFFMAAATLVVWLTHVRVPARRFRSAWVGGGVGVVLSAFLALTVARNRLWADPIKLWADAAHKAPNIFVAQAGLGYEQWLAGNCDAAQVAYNRAMDLSPAESDPYVISADCLIGRGRINEAAALLRLGTTRAPRAANVRLILASLEETRFRRPAEALRLCREALQIQPGSVAAQECVQRNQGK